VEFPVLVKLRRSRFFLVALCATHGLALLGVWLTPWPVAWRIGISSLTMASFYTACRQWCSVPSLLLLHPGGRLIVDEGSGQLDATAILCPTILALPSLCVFSWRREDVESGSRRTLAVFRDSAEAESMRRLRVWLRAFREAPGEQAR
jgi:hypothetical protein